MGDARGEHARLACAGPGKHEHRSVGRLNRFALLRIERGEIALARGNGRGNGARRDTSRRGTAIGQAGSGFCQNERPFRRKRAARAAPGGAGETARIAAANLRLSSALVEASLRHGYRQEHRLPTPPKLLRAKFSASVRVENLRNWQAPRCDCISLSERASTSTRFEAQKTP
jgi:hypothetical protein